MEIREIEVDTEGLDPAEGHQALSEALAWAHQTEMLTSGSRARLRAYRVGDHRLSWLRAGRLRSTRTLPQVRRSALNSICFQYAISGRAVGRTALRSIHSPPDSLLILDLAQTFRIEDVEPRSLISLTVPTERIVAHGHDPATLHGQNVTGGAADLFRSFMRPLLDQLPSMPGSAGSSLSVALEGIAALTAGQATEQIAASPPSSDRLIDRALVLIDANIASSEIGPEWLATRLNTSRSRLYSLFRAQGGVAKFIWRRRLEGARAMLARPDEQRPIGAICFAYGFASEAHFARAFKAAYGMSPSAFRQAARSGAAIEPRRRITDMVPVA